MAGRGFSFKPIAKKEEELKDEASGSSDLKPTPSVVSGLAPSLIAGRGRGLPSFLAPKTGEAGQSDVSSLGIGRGRGMFAVNRPPIHKVATPSPKKPDEAKINEKDEVSASAPEGAISTALDELKISQSCDTKSSLAKIASGPTQSQSPSSGIIAGRGRSVEVGTGTGSGSGRGTSAGYVSKPTETPPTGSDGNAKSGTPVKSTGTIPKATRAPDPVVPSVTQRHGVKGEKIKSMTNCIPLNVKPTSGIYEYEVRFTPATDSKDLRYKCLYQHSDAIGKARGFDGTILYLPKRFPDAVTSFVSENPNDGSQIKVDIVYHRQRSLTECIQLYNILFHRIFSVLKYKRVGQKSFDPTAPQVIPAHKLEIWPGYVTSVDAREGGLMLTLDVSHRVLATRSVLDVLKEAHKSNPSRYKEEFKKAVIGKIVLTRYNNKSYRIDDVLFDMTPESTFTMGEDKQISFVDYYKQQYGIEIRDKKQHMLLSRKEVRISGQKDKVEQEYTIVPEIAFMTGLSDDQKRNFNVMKDLATHTKLSPQARLTSFKKFLTNVNTTPEAKQILSDWGLELANDPLTVTARVLNEERVIFANKREFPVGKQADFTRHATSNEVLEAIDMTNWVMVYVKNDENTAKGLREMMSKISGPIGMRVSPPRNVIVANDRTETFVTALRKEINDPKIQIVLVLFPSLRDDRYAAVKKTLCTEIPVPSQIVNTKTLRNETKNRSIVLKILLQMNCKMGGTLWGVKIPLAKTMICGIDTYHEAGHKGITVGGFVASLNAEFTRWYSKPTIQDKREELVNGLTACMESALQAYKNYNETLPDRIILYRDGVGDGQLEFVQNYEIGQFKAAFNRVHAGYAPGLTFIIVQKRINRKFFLEVLKNNEKRLENPPPGSVLDTVITNDEQYNFFLIAQFVREGTSNPAHFIVLKDENNFDGDILQRLTFKLTFMYYNWPGTVRVPAPCQYAHKLADMVGMAIKKQVAKELEDKLFFL